MKKGDAPNGRSPFLFDRASPRLADQRSLVAQTGTKRILLEHLKGSQPRLPNAAARAP